ncbi:hypothetical protein ABW636_20490 [Aquimarina sp. 2201CG1-2-11]
MALFFLYDVMRCPFNPDMIRGLTQKEMIVAIVQLHHTDVTKMG